MEEIISVQTDSNLLKVGVPSTEGEFGQMFELRTKIYREKGYISPDENDLDEYDTNHKCKYFIAKVGPTVVGTLRLIMTVPLPTEKDFNFEEPEAMKAIPENQRAEISRLIADHNRRKINFSAVQNLVKASALFGQKNGYQGGYSFIKNGLERILGAVGIPVHIVEPHTLHYEERLLYNYFHKGSEVKPIYYLRDKVLKSIKEKQRKSTVGAK